MWPSLLGILIDPVSKQTLRFEPAVTGSAQDLEEGKLIAGSNEYPVTGGIPRFVWASDADQQQTSESFSYKWQRRSSYESPEMHRKARRWLIERYGFCDVDAMAHRFGSCERVLDAGCGSGFSSSLWMTDTWRANSSAHWYGADISRAIDVARTRLGASERLHYVQADVMQLPFAPASFDVVFCEGVLHHTPSTQLAFQALLPLLKKGGEIMFYVYRQKAPVREFADDHVRAAISALDPETAWGALRPLTALGRALSDLHATVEVKEDVPCLGIRAGFYDVQRLIYWHFAKMFWSDDLGFEENNHVNFDWYHPRYAHRHTEEEVKRWCSDGGLQLIHFDSSNESGFTVRATRVH